MPVTSADSLSAATLLAVGVSVNSTAIRCWMLVCNDDGDPDLLVLFNSGDTVYRYAFRAWDDAKAWDALQDDPETSWGQQLHRRIKEGAILTV